jgi:hypothetical protein
MGKKRRKSDPTSLLTGDPIIGTIMGAGSFWLCRFKTFLSKSLLTGAQVNMM